MANTPICNISMNISIERMNYERIQLNNLSGSNSEDHENAQEAE